MFPLSDNKQSQLTLHNAVYSAHNMWFISANSLLLFFYVCRNMNILLHMFDFSHCIFLYSITTLFLWYCAKKNLLSSFKWILFLSLVEDKKSLASSAIGAEQAPHNSPFPSHQTFTSFDIALKFLILSGYWEVFLK